MKPGHKTSEFYLTIAAYVLGLTAFVVGSLLPETHWAVQATGLAVAGLGQIGYTLSRGKVKAAASAEGVPVGESYLGAREVK